MHFTSNKLTLSYVYIYKRVYFFIAFCYIKIEVAVDLLIDRQIGNIIKFVIKGSMSLVKTRTIMEVEYK